MIVETYNTLSYDEFDNLAASIGVNYEFLSDYEVMNGASYAFEVSEKDAKEFKQSDLENPSPYNILAALVAQRIIGVGKYLVQCYW